MLVGLRRGGNGKPHDHPPNRLAHLDPHPRTLVGTVVDRHRQFIRQFPQEDYDALLAQQDGHCAICPSTPKTRRLHVDHDHKTLRVRGLLCHRCNRTLPNWVTADWLRRAAEYLEGEWPASGEKAA